MGKTLTSDQVKANERIHAWLNDRPYQEYPGQRHPRVPQLSPAFVLRTYTPPAPEWSEAFFTPLAAGRRALADVEIRDGMSILEPCAGIGHLLHCLPQECRVEAYEIVRESFAIGAKLFPWADWRCGNVFDYAADLVGRFDLVICNPPFSGGKHLGPEGAGWHAAKSEYLFLELAARALKPDGRAVFIAPHNFVTEIPDALASYCDERGFTCHNHTGPLPGDFLQTPAQVHAFYFVMAPG